MASLNKTFLPNKKYENRTWFLVDCNDKKLGRLVTVIIGLLKGKINSNYHSSIDIGHYVILTNAKLIRTKKTHKHFLVKRPGRPGRSLKIRTNENLSTQLILKRTVKRMLSEKETKNLMKRLYIYNNSVHSHSAQNPIKINV